MDTVAAGPVTAGGPPVRVRHLGRADYPSTWQAMKDFTAARTPDTPDEFWLLEHDPVFTLGLAGRREHLLRDIGIPVIATDRGGQVTYHGPGQVVIYLLIDLRRRHLGIREAVQRIEQGVIDLLAEHGIAAHRRAGAPGVYVERQGGEAKIASLGLKVRNHCTYHGVALNADMDLSPFAAINPCGYSGLAVTQTRDLGLTSSPAELAEPLARSLSRALETETP